MTLRIGILGGTFDPVHNAHLAIAGAALSGAGLQQVLWIPTGQPPYRSVPVAGRVHRLAMIKLAIEGEARYAVDDREMQPGASGYTYDTVRQLKDEKPEAQLTLLMGADQYAKRATWHRWTELEKLCDILVVARPGAVLEADARTLPMTPLPISASEIRTRIIRNEDVSAMVPPKVMRYIYEKGLYR